MLVLLLSKAVLGYNGLSAGFVRIYFNVSVKPGKERPVRQAKFP